MAGASSLLSTAIFNGIICIICLAAFDFLRGKYLDIYSPRCRLGQLAVNRDAEIPEPCDNIFGLLIQLFQLSDEQLLLYAGLDGYVYLRYLRLCWKICIICTAVALPLLCTVYVTAVGSDEVKGIDALSMANIEAQGNRLWAPFFCAYIFTAALLYLLFIEYEHFVAVKKNFIDAMEKQNLALHDWLQNISSYPGYSAIQDNDGAQGVIIPPVVNDLHSAVFVRQELNLVSLQSRSTVMLEGLPVEYRSSAALKTLIEKQLELYFAQQQHGSIKSDIHHRDKIDFEGDYALYTGLTSAHVLHACVIAFSPKLDKALARREKLLNELEMVAAQIAASSLTADYACRDAWAKRDEVEVLQRTSAGMSNVMVAEKKATDIEQSLLLSEDEHSSSSSPSVACGAVAFNGSLEDTALGAVRSAKRPTVTVKNGKRVRYPHQQMSAGCCSQRKDGKVGRVKKGNKGTGGSNRGADASTDTAEEDYVDVDDDDDNDDDWEEGDESVAASSVRVSQCGGGPAVIAQEVDAYDYLSDKLAETCRLIESLQKEARCCMLDGGQSSAFEHESKGSKESGGTASAGVDKQELSRGVAEESDKSTVSSSWKVGVSAKFSLKFPGGSSAVKKPKPSAKPSSTGFITLRSPAEAALVVEINKNAKSAAAAMAGKFAGSLVSTVSNASVHTFSAATAPVPTSATSTGAAGNTASPAPAAATTSSTTAAGASASAVPVVYVKAASVAASPRSIIWRNVGVHPQQQAHAKTVTNTLYVFGLLFWSLIIAFIALLSRYENFSSPDPPPFVQ